MNFFKSILSDDPDPPKPEHVRGSDPDSPLKPPNDDGNSKEVAGGDPADGWSFGGLIKTLASRSESVIEIYRRDLQEFRSGLQKETEILRETASRAVKDLPASLEARASAAHGALDGVLKSTAEIISKETRIFTSDGEPETPETNRSLNSGRYSWFDAQLSAIQIDLNTFCEDPEDVEEYGKWKSGFELEENRDAINSLIGENGTLESVYKKLVPNAVDPETFWCRYFYRVDKLRQQENVRASLVKRAISVDDEEELSWDIDDEEEDGNGSERMSGLKVKGGDGLRENVATHGNLNPVEKQEDLSSGSKDKNEEGDVNNVNMDDGEKNNVVETVESSKKSSTDDSSGKEEVKSEEVAEVKRDENVKSEENVKEKDDEKVIA
ncbi:hypothetical protein CDL12_19736 [Handroanthus impetiginosus]|uniref:BSD domain-containing protein n=1 Tax=Handroanthus impetiginosus TaxID=429701 RepID=A0A2G9GQZ2_9LAMI|nr:hypothetical protein CDL12_19736 [Handroanthus impetiginosus]